MGNIEGEHRNERRAQKERLTKIKSVLKSHCGGLNEAYRFEYMVPI